MKEYIYTTWTRSHNQWVKDMLASWRRSKKPYLCFPWIKFRVHTLPETPFWLYMYYAEGLTDVPALKGKFEYRLHVNDWSGTRFSGEDIHLFRGDEDGKVWFLCDRYQEIAKAAASLISLQDFSHVDNKNLTSTMRNSIPPVLCEVNIRVIEQYPK
jgi:hypothetical protein